MKLASGIAPIVDYLDRGINVALGNDGPPCNNTLDPFTEAKQASILQKADQLDPTVTPKESILDMATVNGAKAAGFDTVGELKPGWKADIIGISTDNTQATPLNDILSYIVFAAHGENVEFTMVDGEVLMEDNTVTVVDAESIRQDARRAAESLDIKGTRSPTSS
jgi:guanine deaminase